MSKRSRDSDFVPDSEENEDDYRIKHSKKTSFLTQHEGDIWELHKSGSRPTDIARSLCSKYGLPSKSIDAKQISTWLFNHKKSGKGKTRKVSLQNNNLRANTNDNWYSNAVNTAKQGKKLKDESVSEVGDDEDEEKEDLKSLDESEIAGKYVRFFTYTEENIFALFVECGLEREIRAAPSSDHLSIELSIYMPLPSDKLFHKAGFNHATKISFEETKETFKLAAPARLSSRTTDREVVYYPNEQTPFWLVFKYKLEERKMEEKVIEVKVNLAKQLLKKND